MAAFLSDTPERIPPLINTYSCRATYPKENICCMQGSHWMLFDLQIPDFLIEEWLDAQAIDIWYFVVRLTSAIKSANLLGTSFLWLADL